MKHLTVALALMALVVLGSATACGSGSTRRMITVSASAEVKAKPNLAAFSFGVASKRSTASAALDANSKAMQRVIAAIKAQGVTPRDIQTQNVEVSPTYSHGHISGYHASNTIDVKMHRLGAVGTVISRATAAGANLEGGLSFSEENTDLTYRRALVRALAKAKANAAAMAENAGLSLGKPTRISEGSREVVPVYHYLGAVKAAPSMGVPVEPGRVTTSATVTVVYSME
jgi:uncharacterized protein YggE